MIFSAFVDMVGGVPAARSAASGSRQNDNGLLPPRLAHQMVKSQASAAVPTFGHPSESTVLAIPKRSTRALARSNFQVLPGPAGDQIRLYADETSLAAIYCEDSSNPVDKISVQISR